MKKEQVVNCQFSVWYPIFKKHTIKRYTFEIYAVAQRNTFIIVCIKPFKISLQLMLAFWQKQIAAISIFSPIIRLIDCLLAL